MDELSYYEYLTDRSRLRVFIRQFFIRDLARHFSGLVLDVGCGIGEFLKDYPASIGTDINSHVILHCKRFGHTCCVSDGYDLPFTEESFDGVLVSNVLEHLRFPQKVVAEASRVLKPGGTLVVTVPTRAGFRRDTTHITFLEERDLEAIASMNALETREMYSFPLSWRVFRNLFYFCELRGVFEKSREL